MTQVKGVDDPDEWSLCLLGEPILFTWGSLMFREEGTSLIGTYVSVELGSF